MPWEISLINGDKPGGEPLGSREYVLSQLLKALPGAKLQGPPRLPEEVLATMPPTLRESMNRSQLEAVFEHADFSIQFSCIDSDPITFLNGEVRGDGDPLPALATLCEATGWSVWDAARETVVNFGDTDNNDWREFCELRRPRKRRRERG